MYICFYHLLIYKSKSIHAENYIIFLLLTTFSLIKIDRKYHRKEKHEILQKKLLFQFSIHS